MRRRPLRRDPRRATAGTSPPNSTSRRACCGRWAADRTRFALYWEDESGATSAHTFWDLQREANRLSNVLAGLGVSARRQGRADPAAAPRNGRRAHRRLSDGRDRGSAVVPVRTRRARIPARQFRSEGRAGRPAVGGRTSRRSAASFPGSTHVVGAAGAHGADLARLRHRGRSGITALRRRRHTRGRSRAHRLHERHHRPAEGRADAASLPDRQPAGLRAFARRLSAAGRRVLVAGRLGVDRRSDGRAAAHAVFRPADRRLPRPLRPRARVPADGEIPDPQRVPVPDGAQADDESVSAAARSISTSTCAAS